MSRNVPEGAEIFQDWSLYDKVIHFNYMQHREMAQVIRAVAAASPQPLHVLDLGCGDGRMAREGLRDSSVASYVGVDLSPAALDSAKVNLSHLCTSIELRHSDLAAAIQESFHPAPNLLLASYSLHHYRLAELADWIGQVAKVMAPGGAFLWIDLERQERETRAEFLERFYRQQLGAWTSFSQSEIQEIMQHMEESDFPLTATEKQQLTTDAGLRWLSKPTEGGFYVAHICAKQEGT